MKLGCILSLISSFFVFQLNAQCDFALDTKVTPSDCFADGSVQATLSGADIQLNDVQITLTNALGIPTASTTNGQIFKDLQGGTYTVKATAKCKSGATVSKNTSVTIKTSYKILQAHPASNSRKTLNCIPTGMIPLEVQDGRPPYTVKLESAPAGYPTNTFTMTEAGTLVFDDMPAGTYKFSLTDACKYNLPLTLEVKAVVSDYPADPFYTYLYPTIPPGQDCKKSIALPKVANADLDYYWNKNRDKYYEVAFSTDGSKPWQATIKTHPARHTVSLPYSYKEMRSGNKVVNVYLKIKGTNCEKQTNNIRLLPLSATTMETSIVANCNLYALSFNPYQHTAIHDWNEAYKSLFCYPYDWEARDDANTLVASKQGVNDVSKQLVTGLEFDREYTITITDSEGEKFSFRSNLKNGAVMKAESEGEGCAPKFGMSAVKLLAGSPIPLGTRIEYLSGPAGAPVPFNKDVTLTLPEPFYFPYSTNYRYIEYLNLPEGKYQFKVTDPCGQVTTLTHNHVVFKIKDFAYSELLTCNGLEVTPRGLIYFGVTPQKTFFKMTTAPEGVDISQSKFQSTDNGKFLLPKSGRYVFQISTSLDGCAADSTVIDLVLERLGFKEKTAFVCTPGGVGTVSVRAKDGTAPYSYQLLADGVPIPGMPANNTGDFQYTPQLDVAYSMEIKDACGRNFVTELQIIDLASAQFIETNSPVCLGTPILLSAVGVGSVPLQWTGPNGFSSTKLADTILNAQAIHEGTYSLTFKPFGCGSNITREVKVSTIPSPLPPIVANYRFCKDAESAVLSATALTDHTLKWYTRDPVTLVYTLLDGAPEPPTETVGTQFYYVSQTGACESEKAQLMATILPPPSPPIATGTACENDVATVIIKNSVSGFTYNIYTSDTDATPSVTVTGSGSDLSVEVPGAITASGNYFVEAVNDLNCASVKAPAWIGVTQITLTPASLPTIYADEFYSVQLGTNATNPTFTLIGTLPLGLTLDPASGLLSGTVSKSDIQTNTDFNVRVTEPLSTCYKELPYQLRTCESAPTVSVQQLIYCKNEKATPLTVDKIPGLEVRWYEGSQSLGATAPTPDTKVVGTKSYFAAYFNTALNCEGDKVEIIVTVLDLPLADFTATSKEICAGTSATIDLDNLLLDHTYTVYKGSQLIQSLKASATSESIALNDPITSATDYVIYVSNAANCASEEGVKVTAKVRTIDMGPEKLPNYRLNTPYTVQFSNTQFPSTANPVRFSLVEGSLPSALQLSLSGELSGKVLEHVRKQPFTIEVVDNMGCKTRREYELNGSLFVPNIFSPNGDGYNDVFMKDYRVIIFDRLGIKIYEGPDGWDGTYKGKTAPEDTYFYLLYYLNENDQEDAKEGFITLVH